MYKIIGDIFGGTVVHVGGALGALWIVDKAYHVLTMPAAVIGHALG